MRKSDFNYRLPAELIAQTPTPERSGSRLLVLHRRGDVEDRRFSDIGDYLRAGDVLVFNNTRVLRARLYAHKSSGGQVELLVERILDAQSFIAQARCSKPLKIGMRLAIAPAVFVAVAGRHGDSESAGNRFWLLRAETATVDALLEQYGHMPLPPYIARPDEAVDAARYQTVYAAVPGAVAAPTAGLHFDAPLLARLQQHGVEFQFVTLHVGAGTFQPLRVDDIHAHRMHSELFSIDAATAAAIDRAKRERRRVIAVGTTVVRALESAARDVPDDAQIAATQAETDIFIYPGYRFQIVDALVTNFHLPESTLLMLVSAFAGRERTLAAYTHAVQARYRFFSYGDAMFID